MRRVATLACCAFVVVLPHGLGACASRLEDKAVEVGPGIAPPSSPGLRVLETPAGVEDRHAHAKVAIRLLIDKAGQVRRAEALDAPDPRLAAAAVEYFAKSSFRPATRDKKPLVVWFNKSLVFRPSTELDAEIPPASCVTAADDAVLRDDEWTDDVELPRLIEKVEPAYPPSMIASHVEGQARFGCVVDTCGRVRDCRVLNASHGQFETAGLDAVIHRRYAPARRHGKPVAVRFTIAVTWGAR